MNKPNIILAVILLLALAAVPVMYTFGMQRYKADLDEQFATEMEVMRQANAELAKEYDAAMVEALHKQELEWERNNQEFVSSVREALLNSGVTLDQLDAVPMEGEAAAVVEDLSIRQSVYSALKKGQTYEEVAEQLGRDGENILNIEDGDGLTSSYEWRWDDVNGDPQSLGVTFVNNKLSHKTYSAFVF